MIGYKSPTRRWGHEWPYPNGVGLAHDVGHDGELTDAIIGAVARAAMSAYPVDNFAIYESERDRRQDIIIGDHRSHGDAVAGGT